MRDESGRGRAQLESGCAIKTLMELKNNWIFIPEAMLELTANYVSSREVLS